MSLDCGRKPEHLEETHQAREEHANSTHTVSGSKTRSQDAGGSRPPVPDAAKQPHSIMGPPPCLTVGRNIFPEGLRFVQGIALTVWTAGVVTMSYRVLSSHCTCRIFFKFG
ncbi:hypothetical protein QTP86_002681 [Hemibagrus guttatus]|nr:hypothetical protein QTP86_002681 [Hemibagrus guttatus]